MSEHRLSSNIWNTFFIVLFVSVLFFLIRMPIDFPLSRITGFQSTEFGILSRLNFFIRDP